VLAHVLANYLAPPAALPVAIVVIVMTCAAWMLMYFRLASKQRQSRSARDVAPSEAASFEAKRADVEAELLAAEMAGFRRATPLLALPLVALAGFGLLSMGLARTSSVASPTLQTVFVADGDGQTTRVELPAADATLLAALNRAGTGSTNQPAVPAGQDEEPKLVAVRRADTTTTVYYFPLPLVQNGLPGGMPLRSEDTVSVVDLAATSLGVLDSTEPGVPFEVRGLIERPGSYKSVEMSEFVANANTPEYGGSFSTGKNGPDVIVVTRSPDATGLVEKYFVPIAEPWVDPYLLQSRIQPGDVLEYARLANLKLLQPAEPSP
jgi:hypothetical protein